MTIEDLLKINNLKLTKGRVNILSILIEEPHSLDAEGIYKELQKKNINLNLSTIYRNLETFYKNGLVEKFDLGNGKYNFSFKTKKHTHTIHCKVCHKEVKIECPLSHIEEIINKETGFSNIDHDLKVQGICKNCMKKNKV